MSSSKKAKGPLLWVVTIFLLLIVAYKVDLLKKIGVPGFFEAEFAAPKTENPAAQTPIVPEAQSPNRPTPPPIVAEPSPVIPNAWSSQRFTITRAIGGTLKTCEGENCVELQVDPMDETMEPPALILRLLKANVPSFERATGGLFGGVHLGRIRLVPGAKGFIRFAEIDVEMVVLEITQSSVVVRVDLLPGSFVSKESKEREGGHSVFNFGICTPPDC